MVTFSLVVVRHGATDANEQGIIQGQSDHRLNETGRRQASLLGRHFRQCQAYSSFTHAFSSDLSRAKETADIILRTIGGDSGENQHGSSSGSSSSRWSVVVGDRSTNRGECNEDDDVDENRSKLICDTRLRERKYGVLEGKSTSVHKQAAMKSSVSPAEYTPDGGETLRELYGRMSEFFRDLCVRVAASASSSRIQQQSNNVSSSSSRSILATTPPSPKIPMETSQQQQVQQIGSNRSSNNRMQTSSSSTNGSSSIKVSRTSSLIPLPEQMSVDHSTSAVQTSMMAPPVFYLPNYPSPSPRSSTNITGKQGSSSGDFTDTNNEMSSTTGNVIVGGGGDLQTTRESRNDDDYSPFASSRDSGISAASDGSLFVDTQLAERRFVIVDAINNDRMAKRSYSACSSPGFSTCTTSPCESTDVTIGDDSTPNNDRPPPVTPSSAASISNSWAYLYGPVGRTVGARKVSVQSIASDDANFPDLDAQILVVTHGGAIRELFRYFVDELGCLMIGGKGAALRPCPNTGVSSFMVNVNAADENGKQQQQQFTDSNGGVILHPKYISVICLGLHSKEHLTPWAIPPSQPPPLSTSSAPVSGHSVEPTDSDEDNWFSRRPHTPPCDVSDFFFANEDGDDGEEEDEEDNDVRANSTTSAKLPKTNLQGMDSCAKRF